MNKKKQTAEPSEPDHITILLAELRPKIKGAVQSQSWRMTPDEVGKLQQLASYYHLPIGFNCRGCLFNDLRNLNDLINPEK